jgi:uncharacterized protein YndB with AHSA1/START domain
MAKKNTKSGGKKAKAMKKVVAKKAVKKVATKTNKKISPKKSKSVTSKNKAPKKGVKITKKTAPKKITQKAKNNKGKVAIDTKNKIDTKKTKTVKPTPTTKHILSQSKTKNSNANSIAAKNNIKVPTTKQKNTAANKVQKNTSASNNTPVKLPANAFELEYVVHASAELLFTFLTEPSGLSEWFCDDVNIRNGIYTFFWDGTQQQAKEIKVIQDKLLRLQWMEKSNETYFEYRIEKDDLTSDISLIITDFADSQEEKQSSILLWNSQIDKLLHVMGAYF